MRLDTHLRYEKIEKINLFRERKVCVNRLSFYTFCDFTFIFMIKKYLPLFLIPLVSSCSLLGGARDFDGMYKAHMRAQVESLRDVAETLGIGRKMTVDGSTKVHLSVPGVMSGVLSSEYTSKVDGKNVEFMARNLMMAYEALIASGSVNLDTLGITTHEGDTYFRYENFRQSNMLSPDMFDIFGRYDKQWLSLTKKEVSDSFSGASTDDILSYRLSENLSSLTLDEVDEFLTKYPVLKETKDL